MLAFFKPNAARIAAFLYAEKDRPYSYREVGHSRENESVAGYDNDCNTIELGQGDAAWAAAREAVRQWKMFPGGWAFVSPENQPIQPGTVVVMATRVLGLWWLNSCRMVYVLDEARRFGFAYGTLPGHVECGEELFSVERTDDDRVLYVLRAFSRPQHWMARLGYPLARMYQRKFVRESKEAMRAFVQNQLS